MIYVSKKQLGQVEYLIGQSIQGNHVLFDIDALRQVFFKEDSPDSALDEEQAYAVEHHIERLMKQPSLERKRAYLDQLDPETYEWVVRTYFNIIENNISSLEVRH